MEFAFQIDLLITVSTMTNLLEIALDANLEVLCSTDSAILLVILPVTENSLPNVLEFNTIPTNKLSIALSVKEDLQLMEITLFAFPTLTGVLMFLEEKIAIYLKHLQDSMLKTPAANTEPLQF